MFVTFYNHSAPPPWCSRR